MAVALPRVASLAPAIALLVALAGPGSPARAQQIGINSAVNPDATGTPPDAATRQLVVGQEVIHDERIHTGSGGQSQLLFLDESAMTIGPNSDVTIDEFVYDPKAGTGKLAMSATQGVFRFVGGKISKLDNGVTLRTPTAALGIRGGVFLANVSPQGETEVVFLYGKGLSITANGVTQTIVRPGFAVTVAGRGVAPTAPTRPSSAAVGTLLGRFNGRSGASGGTKSPPTNASVAKSGIAKTVSGNVAASDQQAKQNTPTDSQPPTINVGAIQSDLNINTTASQAAPQVVQSDQIVAVGNYAGGFKQILDPSLGFIDQSASGIGTFADGAVQDGRFAARLPALGGVVSFPLGCTNSSTTCTPLTDLGFAPGFSAFVGAAAGSATPIVFGVSYVSADNSFFFGQLFPLASTDPTQFVFGGLPVSPSFFEPPETTQISAFAVQPDAATLSPVPFTTSQYGGFTVGNPVISPFYVVAPAGYSFGAYNADANPNVISPRFLQASLGIDGQGVGQNSQLVIATGAFATSNDGNVYANGPMRGSLLSSGDSGPTRLGAALATVADGNGNALFGSDTIQGFVLDQNNYDSGSPTQQLATAAPFGQARVDYAFTNPVIAAALPDGIGDSRTTQTLGGAFSGAVAGILYSSAGSPYIAAGSATVSTDATTNRVAASFALGDPYTPQTSGLGQGALVLQFGGLRSPADGARSAFIDDNTFAATDSQSTASTLNGNPLPIESPGQPGTRIAMVSSGVVPVSFSGVTPNGDTVPVTPCSCQYLQWGYWTGEVDQVDSNGALARYDRAHINTWVAGIPTVNLPTSGTATYNGAAIGSVYNNGASYIAAGNYNGTFNFGNNTGTAAISNFDGRNIAATVKIVGPNNLYHGTLAQAGSTAYSGNIFGNFFGPNAVETGGYFAFRNIAPSVGNYLAAGIFAGKQ